MVAILIAVLITYTAAFTGALALMLRYLQSRDARDQTERHAHRADVADLLQRIQAPQEAVYEHATQHAGEPTQTFPPTDDDLVELQDAELAAALAKVDELQVEAGVL